MSNFSFADSYVIVSLYGYQEMQMTKIYEQNICIGGSKTNNDREEQDEKESPNETENIVPDLVFVVSSIRSCFFGT